MERPSQSLDFIPIWDIWGKLENKLDRSLVDSEESRWLELPKSLEIINVEDLRKIYWDWDELL